MMNVACKGRRVKELDLYYNIHYILHAGTISLSKKLVNCLDVIAQIHLRNIATYIYAHAEQLVHTYFKFDLSASKQRHIHQILTTEELGSRKPSHLLRRMQQLLRDTAGLNLNNSLLQELFLQRLPNQVQMVLASAEEMTLEAHHLCSV